MNQELLDVQAGCRKGIGTRDQIVNIHWIREKGRELQKKTYFCFIEYTKAFDCVDHNKLWNILQAMGIPVHLTCLLRNLYAGQEAKVRTGQTWNNRLVPNWEKRTSQLYIVTLLSTSCEMPRWMKHKLESRLTGKISIISDMSRTPPIWQKAKRN